MRHIREGKHGARSTKQAIAIGLSKARRTGVKLPPPGRGKAKKATRVKASRDYQKGQARAHAKPSPRKAVRTKGPAKRRAAAHKAARARQRHRQA
jgi:hypothetical protein